MLCQFAAKKVSKACTDKSTEHFHRSSAEEKCKSAACKSGSKSKGKNKLETEPERKKKFGKEFAEIPKGKRYVEELEPLLGAVIVLECDDWVFIPGELGGMPCEKLLLKSVKLVKCPASRGVECPVKISKKIWTAVDADFRERLGLKGKIDKYKSGIHGRTPIHVRGRVYEHKVFIDGINGKFVKKNIGFQCFSMGKVGDR